MPKKFEKVNKVIMMKSLQKHKTWMIGLILLILYIQLREVTPLQKYVYSFNRTFWLCKKLCCEVKWCKNK